MKYDKDESRKTLLKKLPKFGEHTRYAKVGNKTDYRKIVTPELIQGIIKLWPEYPNLVICRTFGINESELMSLAIAIRKNGIKLEKKAKTNLSDLVKEALTKLKK